MNNIERNRDVVFNNPDLEDLYTFKNFPVFMGCTDEDETFDVLSDMSWKISKKSGMIQLNPLIPLELVYNNQHGSGTTGKSWIEHHLSFADFIDKYKPKNVLEIGGLHGILAEKFLQKNPNTKWTIIDPNPVVSDSLPINVIKGFFDNNFSSLEKFDTIIHSHLFEHVYNPDEFMAHKSSFMSSGNLLIFSVPNMGVMLKRKFTNFINFEHTIHLTQEYIDYFLSKYNFEVKEKFFYKDDHSIFYCAEKVSNSTICKIPEHMYNMNKNLFEDYISSHLDDVNYINKMIEETNMPVYLFGAHVFSQFLINFGLNISKIVCLLDNDSKKDNKRLYGTSLISKSPNILKDVNQALVILRAGTHNEEIKDDILKKINPNILFI
jgi:2-polyprenyl-3-methyl-5-hydroxy-6-metoxy-1,4-benzoquinol methylase